MLNPSWFYYCFPLRTSLLVMGPEADVSGARPLPARPRFSLDIRTVTWMDGVSGQLTYAKAVSRWCPFHESLYYINAN